MKKGNAREKHRHGDAATVLALLKARGHKMTKVRKHIVEAMHAARAPQSIRGLALCVEADEASVYRTVNLLLSEDLAEPIPLPDESFVYALKTGHHHHLVCVSCSLVAHIACDDERMLRPRRTPFAKILGHEVTFYGLCKRCEGGGV